MDELLMEPGYKITNLLEDKQLPCPYNILTQFNLWFEWHRRVYFEKERPNPVSWDMLGIIDRATKKVQSEIERKIFRPQWYE